MAEVHARGVGGWTRAGGWGWAAPGVKLAERGDRLALRGELAMCMLSHSVTSNSLRPHELWPTRLFCPWDFFFFLGKNIGLGCHFLLQGIFLDTGIEPASPAFQADFSSLSHLGSSWG